jgi:8-oxo-dGTP pyrophosphatase MutT (NUDIX family)
MAHNQKWNKFLNEDKKKNIASIVCINDDQQILILRRSKTDKHKPLRWDLPGGHIDPSDNSLEAGAVRELQEEADLKVSVGDLIYVTKRELHKANRYIFVTTKWTGKVELKPNPKTDIIEHDEYKWATIEEIKELEQSIIPNYILSKAFDKIKK